MIMNSGKIADLDLNTIIRISGMPENKDIINPRNPSEMASRVRVTFRPVPDNYGHPEVVQFRDRLMEILRKNGVQVIHWEEASTLDTDGILSRVIKTRKVKRNIDAVIDVKRTYSITRKVFSRIAEGIYSMVRNNDRSVMDILKISGWADDFTARYVQDPFNTQIITLMPLDPEFEDTTTRYDKKIAIGLKNLISTMSEIVIGISPANFAIINMNLSDSVYRKEALEDFVYNSLIPKIFAPIKPPILSRFQRGEYNPDEYPYTKKLAELGKELRSTDLFPEGSKFSDKITRQSHRDVVNKILDGRTGVSYGFIAIAEPPQYKGSKHVTEQEWSSMKAVEKFRQDNLREDSNGRWYVRTSVNNKEIFQQIPDIWIVTSRSGCDKTNLNPYTDIVRIGLINGKLHLQVPAGIDLNRRDIRPSFDTYVILAQAMSASLYTPELIENGMPILHFHGYPDPEWFRDNEYHSGAKNPSLPCGTVEAAILNYSAVYEIANKTSDNGSVKKLLCLVESDHGVNILGPDKNYIVERLKNGSGGGHIVLGGKYLPYLKKNAGLG